MGREGGVWGQQGVLHEENAFSRPNRVMLTIVTALEVKLQPRARHDACRALAPRLPPGARLLEPPSAFKHHWLSTTFFTEACMRHAKIFSLRDFRCRAWVRPSRSGRESSPLFFLREALWELLLKQPSASILHALYVYSRIRDMESAK